MTAPKSELTLVMCASFQSFCDQLQAYGRLCYNARAMGKFVMLYSKPCTAQNNCTYKLQLQSFYHLLLQNVAQARVNTFIKIIKIEF